MQELNGLIRATYTTMHDDGNLRLEPIDALAELLVADDVNRVFAAAAKKETPAQLVVAQGFSWSGR